MPFIFLACQTAVFSLPVFYFASIKTSFRENLFFSYLAILSFVGGIIGEAWFFKLTELINISATNFVSAAFFMTAVLFIAIEHEKHVISSIFKLVILVGVFKLLLGYSLATLTSASGTLNSFAAHPELSKNFSYLIIAGVVLPVFELFLFFFSFARAKKVFKDPWLQTLCFAAIFIFVLGLHGVIFTPFDQAENLQTKKYFADILKTQLILGSGYAFFMLIFCFCFKARFLSFLSSQNCCFDSSVREEFADDTVNSSEDVEWQHKRIELATQLSNDGFYDWNLKNNQVYYSSKWKKMLGYDENEISSDFSEWKRLTHPEDAERTLEIVEQLLEGKVDRLEIDIRMKHKNGHWINVFSRANLVLDSENNPAHIIGTHVDVSRLKEVEKALHENELRYKKAQEIGEVGNWEYEIESEKFWGSDEAKRIYGFSPDSDTFTVDEVENCIPERERVHQALVDLIEKNKPYDIEFEIQPINSDKRRIIKSVAELVKDEAGRVVKIAGIVRDVTRERAAEAERLELEEKLRQSQKLEAIGTLAGGIAHDFNNILAAILGYTELSLADVEKGTSVEEYLKEILGSANRAKELSRQILTFARKSEDELAPVQIGIIARDALKFVRSTLPSTIEIKQFISTNAWILANGPQIYRVFVNLLTNSAHAMNNQSGTIEVKIYEIEISNKQVWKGRTFAPGPCVEIKVSDTGCGIPPENLEKIFEPYFTTKPLGKGTGLGLAMVHGIVESYGGAIVVESAPEKGTEFTVRLPVSPPKEQTRSEKVVDPQKGSERILVVDDEPAIVKISSEMLIRLGYEITQTVSSEKALNLFKQNPEKFDLIYTDMTMPGLTGIELGIEIMKIRPEMPVIVASGYSGNFSEKELQERGFKAFISKPVSIRDLGKVVRKALDSD